MRLAFITLRYQYIYRLYFYLNHTPLQALKYSILRLGMLDNAYKKSEEYHPWSFAAAPVLHPWPWHLPCQNELSLIIPSSSSANTPDI